MTPIVINALNRKIAMTQSFRPSKPRKSPTRIMIAPKKYLYSQTKAQSALIVKSGHACGPVIVVVYVVPSNVYVPDVVVAASATHTRFTFRSGAPVWSVN